MRILLSELCYQRPRDTSLSGPRSTLVWVAVLAVGSIAPLTARACATCGCTVNSDAAMGYAAASGWHLNLEYNYINQDQLRGGTGTASAAGVVNRPSDPTLGGGEIEQATLNRYFDLGLSYRPNANWNINLLVPYIARTHSTYGQQQQPYVPSETTPDQLSYARVAGLGDTRLIASYQGLLPTHYLGLQLGVKLPTGQSGTAVSFHAGSDAGSPLDASLQAGTGSTDLILGAYYYQPVSQDFDAFASAQFQAAVSHRLDQPGDDFRPGNATTLSLGVRDETSAAWVPQLQLNLLHKSADQGDLADRPDTAGFVAYLSPGLTVRALSSLYLYGVVQLPVYSDLSGYQLFPRWTATVGLSYAL